MPTRWAATVLVVCLGLPAGALGTEPPLAPWSAQAFGERAAPAPPEPATLKVLRQDHGTLGLNKSVIGTPLRIGSRDFQHGLGTHAASEIFVSLPVGTQEFRAAAGVDNNSSTAGTHGTVVFSVEIDGHEAWKSAVLRGGGDPVEVAVKVPEGAKVLGLKTDTTPDGPAHDHADWADARILLKDDKTMWLDQMKVAEAAGEFLPGDQPPFSFVYGGRNSREFLSDWKRAAEKKDAGGRMVQVVAWTDPATGLKAAATVTTFPDFAAAEWLLRFENTGKEDTPILEKVQALDLVLGTPEKSEVVMDQIAGDDCSERSFMPIVHELAAGRQERFAPNGGRPSTGAFPFFNIQNGDRGLFVAIGWTGQWAASVDRAANGPTRVVAGMELTHLVLHPGEAIRTPRILIMQWQGDRTDAHNRFRRLLLAHYVPRVNGQLPPFALGAQSFNMNAGGRAPEWNTEAGQLRAARINRDIGGETLWMDAGWFDGGFPNGVGNWTVRATEYPNGLGPVGKACADLGLNYLIWWEPERVAPGTRITREHPEFVLGGAKGGLFNLADPKARAWMTDLLLRQIDEFGVRVYRNDFNMDPLPYWRAADAPDRQGITEIRYVEGLYAMWDEIRAKTPGTVPDDCASGGRRIDLEMCMRSIVQTRSDTAGAPGRAEWDQCQTLGLSLFLPLHATFNWETDTYSVRSAATCGYLGEWDILDPAFPVKQATACFAEIKENRKFWYGDFYPLTGWSMAADPWMAWQFDRPDLGEGIVQAFRRAQSPYVAFQARLRGLDAARSYEVALIDDEHRSAVRTMKGADLAVLELRLEKPRSSVVVRYKAK